MISEAFRDSVLRNTHNPCISYDDEEITLTFKDAEEALLDHMRWLETLTHTRVHQIAVAYLSWNRSDLFLSVIACTTVNVRVLPLLLNTRWTASEISNALASCPERSHTTFFILHDADMSKLALEAATLSEFSVSCQPLPNFAESMLFSRRKTISPTTKISGNDRTKAFHRLQVIATSAPANEDALIVFTSGTTSGSKGVRLSHRAILIQSLAKLSFPCGYHEKTAMLATTVPFFHVGGLSSILATWLAGGVVVFPSMARSASSFDPSIVIRSVQSKTINALVVVPAMLYSLLKLTPPATEYPGIDLILIGGQSAPDDMLERLRVTFPCARIVQTYACTEAASSLTFLDQTTPVAQNGDGITGDCIGSPPPHIRICLFDKDNPTIEIQTPYTPGIIATKGPHVMSGYWMKGASEQSPSSWMRTNDLGFRDEQGRLYFCGRAHDTIRTGGETVLANELERVLSKHASIEECAVFALPDERFGEAVSCAIVPAQGQSELRLSTLRQWCREQGLASYKLPRKLYFLSELPRNGSGKILKYRLVHQFGRDTRVRSKL